MTVVEAKNLSNRPQNKRAGLSLSMGCSRQTYAQVELVGCPVPPLQTEVKAYTYDPHFDETFSYGVTSDYQTLRITLKDKDFGIGEDGEKDAFMGRVEVPLSDILSGMALQKKLLDMQGSTPSEALGIEKSPESMVLTNKWYLLEEERPTARRPGASPAALGLVHLSFEFRPRALSPSATPWQIKYLLSPDQCPQLHHEFSCFSDSMRKGILLLQYLSMFVAALCRPLPQHGLLRTPNKMADAARTLAMGEVGSPHDTHTHTHTHTHKHTHKHTHTYRWVHHTKTGP